MSSLLAIKSLTAEEVMSFMSELFKPDVNTTHAAFPYDLSLFTEPIQAIFSLMSQNQPQPSQQNYQFSKEVHPFLLPR